jgi:hypothetical protein
MVALLLKIMKLLAYWHDKPFDWSAYPNALKYLQT